MVCERPPAAFGDSPPREGRRERSERGGRSHTILIYTNQPRLEVHLNLQGNFAIVGRINWSECALQV